jgi:hypothetical protein
LKISDGGVERSQQQDFLILWKNQMFEVGKASRGKGFQEKGLEISQARAMANSKVTRRFQERTGSGDIQTGPSGNDHLVDSNRRALTE